MRKLTGILTTFFVLMLGSQARVVIAFHFGSNATQRGLPGGRE